MHSTLPLIAAELDLPERLAFEIVGAEATIRTPKHPSPPFTALIYTGGALQVKAYPLPVVIDLQGLRRSSVIIANLDHDATHKRVGHVDQVTNDGRSLTVAGSISLDNEASRELKTGAVNGFPWRASIEAQPVRDRLEMVAAGQSVTVNGRTFAGPVLVAREAVLTGFAFLTRPADEQTVVQIAARNHDGETPRMNFEDFVRSLGHDPATIEAAHRDELRREYDRLLGRSRSASATPPVAASGGDPPAATTTQATPPAPVRGQVRGRQLDEILAEGEAEDQRLQGIAATTDRLLAACRGGGAEHAAERELIRAMARRADTEGWDGNTMELEYLRNRRPEARTSFGARGAPITERVIEAALCQSMRIVDFESDRRYDEQTLEAAHREFPNGIGLEQLILVCAELNGYRGGYSRELNIEAQRFAFGMPTPAIHAAGFSTVNLPGILSNVLNKAVRDAFMATDRTCLRISGRGEFRNFYTHNTYSLTGDMEYREVGPGGELTHGAIGEESYTNKLETYGRLFAITRQDLINDNLGALRSMSARIGRGAMMKLNSVFWTTFLNNSTFFAAGNSNISTGALSLAGLNAAETVLMNQTDPDGQPLGMMASILLVPPSVKNTALQLENSMLIVDGGSATPQGNMNVYRGRYRVESSPYMENSSYTGYSATAYYLLCNPADLPVVEIAFLNGREMPTVESADAEFNTLGIQIRGYHDFGVAMQEPRGGVRSTGA